VATDEELSHFRPFGDGHPGRRSGHADVWMLPWLGGQSVAGRRASRRPTGAAPGARRGGAGRAEEGAL